MQIDPDDLPSRILSLTGASLVVVVSTPSSPPRDPRGAEAPLLHRIRNLSRDSRRSIWWSTTARFQAGRLTRTREKCPDTLGRVDFEIEIDIPPDQLRITAVSPEAVLQGTFVTVEGRGFGDRYDEVTVHVGGREALLLSVTPTMIRFRVPHGAGELRPLRITVGTSSVEIDDLLRHAPAPDEGVVGQIGPPAAFTGTAALTGPAPVGLDQPILVIFCSPSDRAPTDGGLTAAQERQRQINTFESLVNPAFRQMSCNSGGLRLRLHGMVGAARLRR